VLPRRCCQWIADRRGDQTLQPDQVREMAREEIEKALTPAINAAVLANCNVVPDMDICTIAQHQGALTPNLDKG
jgi:hypothetical protein